MIKLSRKRKFLVAAVLLIIAAGALAFVLLRDEVEEAIEPATKPSQLTGVEVDPDLAERPILAVVIDNLAPARPQTGLDSAGITFEIVAEGGITRYLALFQENMPEEAGPIRSLRTYFLDWAMGFDASVAHVGGSPEALSQSDERKARSLSQFRYGDSYFRDNNRPSPHNVFAKTQDLRDLQEELKHATANFELIPRKADQASQTPDACTIDIDFSTPGYLAKFQYQQPNNSYSRHLAGSEHLDRGTNKAISVKNVIIIRSAAVGSDQGSPSAAIGSGDAVVYRDGTMVKASWEKDSFNERLKIMNAEGQQISLNRGDTWIAVLPADRSVTHAC